MLSFSVGAFAVAGVAAAAGPIIAHLMNRRRFRTIDWAAMHFLREAVRQSRRVLHLRDLVLLALRTLVVLLFGLAMARPYFTTTGGAFGAGEPIHAVLLVDNSLSTGYRSSSGTLLDEVRTRCRNFLDELPTGSRVTVIPVCSDARDYSLDAAATKQQALDALDAIFPVDRKAGIDGALGLAEEALKRLPDMPNKRVVFAGDGQRINFTGEGWGSRAAALGDVQIVSLGPSVAENAWIADLSLLDGAAVAGADTEFAAVVRYEGLNRRQGVQVNFSVDGQLVQSRVIDLEPNSRRLVTFAHRFEPTTSSDAPRYGVVSVGLSTDRLPDDDSRHLVAPIVEPLPVVYVTEHGPDGSAESVAGRGLWIQRLLAPVVERGDTQPKLIKISHIAPAGLTDAALQTARLVVMAGVRTPGDRVPLLRRYVEQGGRLIIAAGEEFDPVAWNDGAWLDGAGILPAPLAPQTVEGNEGRPLRLDLSTLGHRYFQIEGASNDELTDLYGAPVFLRVVAARPTPEAVAKLQAVETARIARLREERSRAAQATDADGGAAEPATPADALANFRLAWMEPPADRDHERKPEDLAAQMAPAVIGRFDDGLPFLVERSIDRGTVVFCATGLQSAWNTLTLSRAVIVLDRVARALLGRTLPMRNFDTSATVLLPLRPQGSGTYLQLVRPGDRHEALGVDALGDDKYAVVLRNLSERGVYRVVARQAETDAAGGQVTEKVVWETPLAVGGPEQESELASLPRDEATSAVDAAHVRLLGRDDPILVEGATVGGRNLWKWLLIAVLVGLIAELAAVKFLRPMGRPAGAAAGGAA
jgi:hypothetical protein